MRFFRLFVILFLIIGYSLLCFSLCNYTDVGFKKSIVNNDDLKTSKQDLEVSYSDNFSDFLGHIKISKIGVDNDLYSIDSSLNTVDKNIEVLNTSKMPNESGGNFILAAHNGYSPISYFRELDKLNVGDEIFVTYNGADYRYAVDHIYDVVKTGKVEIIRDKDKSTITLITCKDNDKQLVVIGYLK